MVCAPQPKSGPKTRRADMFNAPIPLDLEPVKACFAELNAQHTELERYFEDSFQELESLRADLSQFYEELLVQRRELEQGRRDMEETCLAAKRDFEQQESTKLAALQEEFDAAQAELTELRKQHDEGTLEREESLNRQIEELHQERTRLEGKLETARNEAATLASTVEELSGENGDENTLDAALHDARANLECTMQVVRAKEEQITSLMQERDDLEGELDSVRSRAAELSDTLDQMKRESVEERAEWSAELKQMRRVLERQTDLLTPGPSQRRPVAPPAVSASAAAAPAPSAADPVLGTVVAQFDKIRQERAQQRLKRENESN
jgi:chromosome segregation protein